ncbi:hypothetical protein EJ02DRAFT_453165 [Clathrospora elynae]|uniref:non-specific serine/threonine protein kinase n=1 Tax=Clathrospora elynae TaxID=706981 RepID=A0A6A5SWI6_9PLEO|nr:hypothetical protein EJ02DRAFT_453165 [Clathrospora elynae]
MPKRVLYGKKRNGERQAFGKFLSPEKDIGSKQQEAVSGVTGDYRQQLENAANSDKKAVKKKEEEEDEGGVSVLEKGLKGLRIEQTQTKEEESRTKKKDRSRKGQHDAKAGTKKETTIAVDEDLELDMKALTIDSAKDGDRVQKKPRKALKDRDTNAVNEIDLKKEEIRKEKKERSVERVAATPVNVLQPRRKPKSTPAPQLPTPEPTPEPEDLYSAYASPLLALSDRKKVVPFQTWSEELAPHFEITKIAEASFSEVYRLSSTCATTGIAAESVLKLVALKTPPTAPLPSQLHTRAVRDREAQLAKETAEREEKDQWKSHVADVLSEVKLLHNLTHIPGFTVFRDLAIVQGRPSASFNKAWGDWNKARARGKKSEFPDPNKKSSYDDGQLWAIVEMQDAGTDCDKVMEQGGLASVWEVWDVFWGVCLSVAKAEEACRFEHRDLHLGNICVRSRRAGAGADDVLKPVVKDALRRKFGFTGLETTVIDYTLSRADILPSSSSSPSSNPSRRSSFISGISNSTASSPRIKINENTVDGKEGVDVAYLDLDKDPALFQGDASEEYQYEIYRYMRGVALYGNPLQNPSPLPLQQEELEEKEQEQEVPVTPRRSPRRNTHIRFDPVEDVVEEVQPRRSPRKHAEGLNQNTEEKKEEKKVVRGEEKKQKEEHVWRHFHPSTNLVWMHFLLHKLLDHLSSLSRTPDLLSPKQMSENVQLREGEDANKVKKKAGKLYKVLQRVSELLCPVALGRERRLGSVGELVLLALEERWVRVGDVAG